MRQFQTESEYVPKHFGPAAALQRAADAVSLLGAYIAAACISLLTLLVLLDIILAFLSSQFPGIPSSSGIGWEYSAYLMGGAFLLGSGLTLRAGLQLRVEVTMSSGKAWLTRAFELISAVLGSTMTVSLTIWLAQFTYRTWTYGEVSQDSFTPLWIPQLLLTIGAAVLALQMVSRLVTCLCGHPVNRPELGAAKAIE